MRKIILFIMLLSLGMPVKSQITLEHTYTGSVYIADLEEHGFKYYDMDVVQNQCRLYNLDHSLWKSIPLDVPQDHYLFDIRFVSTALFDLDNLVELAYTYYHYDDVDSFYTYYTNIINENENLLLQLPGAYYNEVISSGNDEYKLLAYVWDFSVYPSTLQTQVYALPGQITAMPEKSDEIILGNIYPNPARSVVHLKVKDDQVVRHLDFLNAEGKRIRKMNVLPGNQSIELNVGKLETGTYFIRVTNMNNQMQIKKLIIS